MSAVVDVRLERFDALVFDLDGVVTRTAAVHAAAWKRLFDELLQRRAAGGGWAPFDVEHDYRTYVDGRPRRDGVRSFLASRQITVPEGRPDDGPERDTVHGLARRKNDFVRAHLERHGVDVHPDAVRLLERARGLGLGTAVVTASENCAAVLRAAGIAELFDVSVDGLELGRLGLRGKPAPDAFLEATRRLEVTPQRAMILEDAIAGVEAGRGGGFALVVGVDRTDSGDALRRAGADVTVTSLDALALVGERTERKRP